MLKALLVASLAMLACCAAAAWAGPVAVSAGDDSSADHPHSNPRGTPLHLIDLPSQGAGSATPFDASIIDGFVAVPLTESNGTVAPLPGAAAEADVSALPDPAVQSAVIPLPTPLYAALALLGIALIIRRVGGLRFN